MKDRSSQCLSSKLVSWNVAGRVSCLDQQVTELVSYLSDLIALQEVRIATAPLLTERLIAAGLPYCINSFDLAPDKEVLVGPRQYGQLIASRWPLMPLPPDAFPVPWPERILSALIDSPRGILEIHNTHIPPGSSNGWTKIEMLEGIYKHLACSSPNQRILCGDFNAPQKELPSGYIVTWGQEILEDGQIICEGTWRDREGQEDKNERWDTGERNIFERLRDYDLRDVYRMLHGYEVEEYSHYVQRRVGRRYDHVFASGSLNAVKCEYLHALRENGLSDHSPIIVIFEPKETEIDVRGV